MIDKERLEVIKKRDVKYLLNGTMIKNDFVWLINRVEELEEHVKDLKIMLKVLGDRNNRYKQALEFYASAHKYTQPVEPNSVMSIIDMDSGLRAREALEGK